ncbi:MAG: hypothetical protein JHC33_10415 [Ignisphaera sp.]|nr:hypothetical protein [Ignisphaera sp.]
MSNPFLKYAPTDTEYDIKSLGAKVILRKLTIKQSQDFQDGVITGLDANNEPIIDFKAALNVKYLKVSAALIEPKMTVDDLKNLGADAEEAIKEILAIVDVSPEAAKGKPLDQTK